MELSIRQKIEIEIEIEFLKELNRDKTRKQALVNVIVSMLEKIDPEDINDKPIKKAMYIYEAYQMPIEEISKEIKRYDTSSPKLDAVKLVDELCKRYMVDRKTVVQRIQNVRRINRYLEFKDTKEREKLLEEIKYLLNLDTNKRK